MRALTNIAVFSIIVVAAISGGCSKPDPLPYKANLKQYLSDTLRKNDFYVDLTDEDPRARPPTKYDPAIKNIAYALRHNVRYRKETPVTVSTWIYKDEKSAQAAREPLDAVIADLKKGAMLYKFVPIDTKALHGYLLIETPNAALSNTFELLNREIMAGIAGVQPQEEPEKK